MSQAHIEKFYEIVASDQELFAQLAPEGAAANAIAKNAVTAAKEHGLEFSVEDATSWIAAQQAANDNGELSDLQLEAVAGGKGEVSRPLSPISYNSGFTGVSGSSSNSGSATLSNLVKG